MNALITEIQSSLLKLIGDGIQVLPGLILAIAFLFFTRYAANLVQRIVTVTMRRVVRNPSLRSLFVQMCYVGTWIVGIIVASVIAFPDLRLGDVIGLLGLSSVAIGFAFQDIFKNFLAGVLLLLNEPFRLGDQVIVKDFEGTVEEITIRSTQILTYQGERVLIPNSIVFTSPVHVLTALPARRTDLSVGLDYSTPLPNATQVLLHTLKQVEGVLEKPAPEIDIAGFQDSAIEFVVRYWTLPQKIYVRQVKTQVIVALKQACDRAGIKIPFPIRTVYFQSSSSLQDPLPVSDKE